jgi:predicted ATP-dependent endonuclease of OLD family
MVLKSVEICNFRSIKNLTISFNPAFQILVGINESGKTNIINALSLLKKDIEINVADIRQSLPDEELIEDSYIIFSFSLSEAEITKVFDSVSKRFKTTKLNEQIVTYKNNNYTLKQLCSLINDGYYKIDLMKITKNFFYFNVSDEFKVINNWKLFNDPVTKPYITDEKNIENKNKSYISDLTSSFILELIYEQIMIIMKENIPNVILWNYEEENLLPASININEFARNPNICIPLSNMFKLADYHNISESINKIRALPPYAFRNLLDRVANHTTDYFKEVWKEYGNIKFSLDPNGDRIDTGIKEKNTYSFNQRSDGFKRFISFLLLISINVKKDNLKNTILLIDEPDSSLHPSGIRFLRDELIKMSKNIIIIASSHSPFFIDSNNIDRHIIVKKIDEKTVIEKPTESNIAEEEVLFRALGISVYDFINKKNIIFEGWRDKELFRIAIEKPPDKYFELKKIFKNVGLCHADGVKKIVNLTPFFEVANRECIILSDNDEMALEKQKDFIKSKGYGEWYKFIDIDKIFTQTTVEDFLKEDFLISIFNEFKKENLDITYNCTLKEKGGYIKEIKDIFIKSGKNGEYIKDSLNKIKTNIFNKVTNKNIKQEYFEYLSKINEIINKK